MSFIKIYICYILVNLTLQCFKDVELRGKTQIKYFKLRKTRNTKNMSNDV